MSNYINDELIVDDWTSPLSIDPSDQLQHLDEAVNDIISDDPQSLTHHINAQMAKIPPYLTIELEKIAGLVDTGVNEAQASAWEAEAEKRTAQSFATEAYNQNVQLWLSSGDGTFYTQDTAMFSSKHWAKVSEDWTPSGYAKLEQPNTFTKINRFDDTIRVDSIASISGMEYVYVEDIGQTVRTVETQTGFRNKFLNGGFNVWKRGAPVALTGSGHAFTADRWSALTSGASTISLSSNQQFGNIMELSENVTSIKQPVEIGSEHEYTKDKIFTLSLWLQYQGSFESSPTYSVIFRDVSNTVANEKIIVSSEDLVEIGQVPTIGAWVKYEKTFRIDDWQNPSNKILLVIIAKPATATTFKMAQLQLEEGSIATPFEQRPIKLEYDLCDRYYYVANATNAFRAMATPSDYSQGADLTGMPILASSNPTIDTSNFTFDNCSNGNESFNNTAGTYQMRVKTTNTALYRVYGAITFSAEL